MNEEDTSIYEELDLLRYKLENLMNENLEQQMQINSLSSQLDEKKRLLDIVCATTNTNTKKTRKRNEESKKMLSFYHENKKNIDVNTIKQPQWQQVKKITDKMYVESLKSEVE